MTANPVRTSLALCLAMVAGFAQGAAAQGPELTEWSVLLSRRYSLTPNVTYLETQGWEAKADIYRPRAEAGPVPTVLFFHGGGWIRGEKEGPVLHVIPYIAMGFAVVNVEYRVAPIAKAPAAIQDARCALHWVYRNATRMGFDTTRVIVTGHSAGGHLALMVGMLQTDAGLDTLCPSPHEPKVAAIVNWYGITDVVDVLEGENRQSWAEEWIGTGQGSAEMARRMSPLTYVRRDLPPILTLHGDSDTTVPHQHALWLDDALEEAGAEGELVTIAGAGHGGLDDEQLLEAYSRIREFLQREGIYRPRPAPALFEPADHAP